MQDEMYPRDEWIFRLFLWEVPFMKCPKCRGRMFAEKYYDFVRSFDAWKCTCCGEVVDPTILANRARNFNSLLG